MKLFGKNGQKGVIIIWLAYILLTAAFGLLVAAWNDNPEVIIEIDGRKEQG